MGLWKGKPKASFDLLVPPFAAGQVMVSKQPVSHQCVLENGVGHAGKEERGGGGLTIIEAPHASSRMGLLALV